MRMVTVLVALCVAITACSAAAQPSEPAKDALIKRYLDASNTQFWIESARENAVVTLRRRMERTGLPKPMVDRLELVMIEEFNHIIGLILPVSVEHLRKTFTVDELTTIVLFFESPVGKAYGQKTAELQNVLMQELERLRPQFEARIQERVLRELESIKPQQQRKG